MEEGSRDGGRGELLDDEVAATEAGVVGGGEEGDGGAVLVGKAGFDGGDVGIEDGDCGGRLGGEGFRNEKADDREHREEERAQSRERSGWESVFHESNFAPLRAAEQCFEAHTHLICFSLGKSRQSKTLREGIHCEKRGIGVAIC
jgi:hypothetical protein